jgi:SAM-dependent methyltransferase
VTVPLPDYGAYAALYDANTSGVAGDVEFYRDLALEDGGPVVELGAGTGRIALPIAEAGVEIVALDLSRAMLAVARRKALEAGGGVAQRLHLARGDMRRFALARPVGLVVIPFRTFLHNLTVEDQFATLASARAALRPNGRLALNVFNPSITMIADGLRRGPEDWQPLPQGGRGAQQRIAYEPTAQLVRNTWSLPKPGGGKVRFSFTLRYVHRYEMEHLLARAGFEVEALYGNHHREPFEETSSEMVWVARPA